jgi:hypothetical protein
LSSLPAFLLEMYTVNVRISHDNHTNIVWLEKEWEGLCLLLRDCPSPRPGPA